MKCYYITSSLLGSRVLNLIKKYGFQGVHKRVGGDKPMKSE